MFSYYTILFFLITILLLFFWKKYHSQTIINPNAPSQISRFWKHQTLTSQPIPLPPNVHLVTSLNAPELVKLLNRHYHETLEISPDHIMWLSSLPNSTWYHFYTRDSVDDSARLIACFYHRYQNVVMRGQRRKQQYVDYFCIDPDFRMSKTKSAPLIHSILSLLTQLSADFSLFKVDEPRILPMKPICKTNYVLTDFTPSSKFSLFHSFINKNPAKKHNVQIVDYSAWNPTNTPDKMKQIFDLYHQYVRNGREIQYYPEYTFRDFTNLFLGKQKTFRIYCIIDTAGPPTAPTPTLVGYFIAFVQKYHKLGKTVLEISNLCYNREQYSERDVFSEKVWNQWRKNVVGGKIDMIGWMEHQNLSKYFAFWKQYRGIGCNWYTFSSHSNMNLTLTPIQPQHFINPY